MAIRGAIPTPKAFAQALETRKRTGELVAPRGEEPPAEVESMGPRLEPTPLFSCDPERVAVFRQIVDSKPRGYFGESDVPLLEKLCFAHVQHQALMRDFGEGVPLIEDPLVPGLLRAHPSFDLLRRLDNVILSMSKHFGLSPAERGRPVVDDRGRPVLSAPPGKKKDDPTGEARGKFLLSTRTNREE